MDRIWLAMYVTLAAAAILQAAIMALQTYEHRRYARRRMAELPRPQPSGRACVLAPCKGIDEALAENLACLLQQDYRDYEVLFLVESASDPACAVIRRAMALHPATASRLLVAGPATQGGQKIHNLLCGVEQAAPDAEYLVFVDSDAQPRRQWLRWLLYRLDEPAVGATTGYRWFLPLRPTLANHLLYSINSAIALFLGPHRWPYVWGGSWAIRRATFERIDLAGAWQGTLSDDMVAAARLRHSGLQTIFQPPCLVLSPADYDLRSMLSFLRRQYLIVRYHSPKLWLLCMLTSGIFGAALLTGLALSVAGLAAGRSWAWIPALCVAVQYGLGVLRGWFRQTLVHTYFPHAELRMRAARRFDILFGPAAAIVHWLGLIGSALGREITWRGIRYRLSAGGQTQRVDAGREEPAVQCLSFPAGGRAATEDPAAETPWRKAV